MVVGPTSAGYIFVVLDVRVSLIIYVVWRPFQSSSKHSVLSIFVLFCQIAKFVENFETNEFSGPRD